MLLSDYVQSVAYPILRSAAVGSPIPREEYVDTEDLYDAVAYGDLGDLTGSVGDDGTWRWDGADSPRDGRGNSYTLITCRAAEPEEWYRLRREALDSEGYLTAEEISRIARVISDPSRIDRYASLGFDLGLILSDAKSDGSIKIPADFDSDSDDSEVEEAAQEILERLHAVGRDATE